MAIASPSTPTISPSFYCKRIPDSTRFSSIAFTHRPCPLPRLQLAISSRLNPSKSSGAGGSVSPDNGGENDNPNNQFELQHHQFSPARPRKGSPVFVTVPVDAVGAAGLVRRRKAMHFSFKALAAAGVEGVVVEVWWGLVEGERPGVYDWQAYLELVGLAEECGLKVRAVLAFHQRGTGPGDPLWIPLPIWVRAEVVKNPDLVFSDRFGTRNREYISLGCDILPVLRGRSPLQVYADFMRNFRDTFRPLLGVIITGIQVGMGPGGELRYPSCPSEKLAWPRLSSELGEFQCFDQYMLASLNACAHDNGMPEWRKDIPIGVSNLMLDPKKGEFGSDTGSGNTDGDFFLEWYSGMLLLHGERICRTAEIIFRGTEVNTSAKVADIRWHYGTGSCLSELTAGYYNTSTSDGLLPITRMFARYGFSLCCSGIERQDVDDNLMRSASSPEGFLKQLLLAARICGIPMEGENSSGELDEESFQQVLKMSKFYSEGVDGPSFSFNFSRMDKDMFKSYRWSRFSRFVRQMSDDSTFRARLDYGDDNDTRVSLKSDGPIFRAGFAYC